MVSYSMLDFSKVVIPFNFGKEFADVLHFFAECFGAFGIGGIIFQQMPVFFERRATASRIDDDGIQVIGLEHVDVVTCQPAPALGLAAVDVERAAATLLGRSDYLAAIRRQHTHGGFIDIVEKLIHDAATDHAHAIAARPYGWR